MTAGRVHPPAGTPGGARPGGGARSGRGTAAPDPDDHRATILGTVPIALALGAVAESRVSLGIAVIGGLLVGTALTLYVVPAMYLLLAGRVVRPWPPRRPNQWRAEAGTRRGGDPEGSPPVQPPTRSVQRASQRTTL
ncbi:MAG TPA: efflux RND transporter permease subunit [Opitutaceae bacterium]|nr:efflux RND transporter permease subunit [Opitutaceae bacterium]